MRFESLGRFDTPPKPTDSTLGDRRIDRRTVLTLLGTSVVAGCRGESREVESAPRTDVPLRVLMVGTEPDAEAIRLAWSMTMEQSLSIETTQELQVGQFAKSDGPEMDLAARLDERMKHVDLAIIPQGLVGEIARLKAAVDLNESLRREYDDQYGETLPAVEEGLGTYGGKSWGIAVGAKVLALLALESDVQCPTWADYHNWVMQFDGLAAEPLAQGWAANSFLNRCALTFSRNWLFNRASMKPEIDGRDYVASLEQLVATAKLYASPNQTPGQIWRAIRRGKLRAGIGFEVPGNRDASEERVPSETNQVGGRDDREEFEVGVFDCPLETDTDRVWFAPQTPIACISAGCRQTDASKRFLGWLSGGERVSTIWQQTEIYSPTRVRPDSDGASIRGTYSRWLVGRLQTRQVVPGLILPGGDHYYRVLDEQVRGCLAGEKSATDALAETAAAWESITDRIGREQQLAAWKRALGFGA